jgi:predicted Fe-S protein YdhL (DUF1289 family)
MPKLDPSKSPCIGVCHIDGRTGFCFGCYRSLPEVAQWHKKTDAERLAILKELPQRAELVDEN